MTKQEFINLLDSVIDGRYGYSIQVTSTGNIFVYSVDNTFTACLITRVVEMTKGYFCGVSSTSNGKPYLLFVI